MATACWSFPIYSQTFVYQELSQLIRYGVDLRFIYSKLDRGQPIPSQFSRLFRVRRRLILHQSVCERSYAYFVKRSPQKIDELVTMLCRASGMTAQEVRSHHHFLQAFAFARMVEAYRPDFLHSYFFYEGTLFSLFASHLLGIPRGVSCYADHMLKDYPFKVIPLHLRQCSVIIATSERIKQELMKIAPQADPNRIIVKPNAINAAAFPVIDFNDRQQGQPYRLVSVSRIEPKKGLVYLIEAVRDLRDRGVDVELHLIGGVDDTDSSRDYAGALEAKTKELNLDGVVHLEGRKSELEIKEFFKNAHLFVAPFIETDSGDKDGIPTSLLEGMSAGLPIVATNAGSITEVIQDDYDGVLVPQRDSATLGKTIEELLRDPVRRRKFGRQAADTLRQRFDVQVCEQIFHDRVRTVIEEYDPITSNKTLISDTPASRATTKVTVVITTYNHERFINDALEGVLMQQTDFDFDVVLIEDCSTDRTRDIVSEYQKAHPDKIKLVLSEVNKCDNSEFMKAILSSPSQYIAVLDGDDYWTSPLKLQKQVDYLDRHPECSICFHDVTIISDDGDQPPRNSQPPDQKEISTLEDLFDGCFIMTCSVLLRQNVFDEFPSWYNNDKSADWSLFVLAAQHGMVGYINEVLAVYRLHPGGFWTAQPKTEQLERIAQFYENLSNHLPARYTAEINTRLAWRCHEVALEYERTGNLDAAQHWLSKCYAAEQDVRKINWQLRVAGGNKAELVFPPDDPEVVRVNISRAATPTAFDIQLNHSYLSLNAASKTGFDIHLNHQQLKVKANENYTIAFRARADRARSISVGLAEAHEPWQGLGFYQTVNLMREWQSYEFAFVATADEGNARIHFDVGDSEIPVEFAAVRLVSLVNGDPSGRDLATDRDWGNNTVRASKLESVTQ
jgi:glycosyltransferase involved in cell wall biosynthesis